jgi:hypothetical protein
VVDFDISAEDRQRLAEKAAKMIRRDLNAARATWIAEAASDAEKSEHEDSDFLLFETEEGRADFHALRHMFITNLAGSGVHPKLAMELARHSTITLTMDRYTHVGLLDMNAALESMPGIPTQPEDVERTISTGTDSIVVATMVATGECDHRSYQEPSLEPDSGGGEDNVNVRKRLCESLMTKVK